MHHCQVSVKTWLSPHPLRQLAGKEIERASLLQCALTSSLTRHGNNGLTNAEFERLGVEDYRLTFGHSISTRHWRRLFKRTLDRDGGAKNWQRLEIYLEESPARRPEFRKRNHFIPADLKPLQELISSFARPAH